MLWSDLASQHLCSTLGTKKTCCGLTLQAAQHYKVFPLMNGWRRELGGKKM